MNAQTLTRDRSASQQSPTFTDHELQQALNKWRHELLGWLGREMIEASEELGAAREGLAVAHRNPGEVSDDVVEYLWDKLNTKAVLLERFDRVVERIEEMQLPELIILFSRTTKLKTYPWEGAAWHLPASMF